MPTRALRPCLKRGCSKLAAEAYCPAHGHLAPKPWAKRHLTTPLPPGWPKIRRAVLARDPICRICGGTRSTVADHVVPRALGGDAHMGNLQGICSPCSKGKSSAEGNAIRGGRKVGR
jgi:5-methylcytosine-specific restriction endonuclease McrA